MGSKLSFVAIDFETANTSRASVCQVGLAKVVNGDVVSSDSWYVVPPTGLDSFLPRFTSIHGITAEQARDVGIPWLESVDRIHQVTGDLPFVAHNASFDRSVYRQASDHVGAVILDSPWYDTVAVSRRFLTSENHQLDTVARFLELPAFNHHEAQADAMTCARIALTISTREQLYSVEDLWGQSHRAPRPRRSVSTTPVPSARKFAKVSDLPNPNPQADPDHPFFDQHVVITGNLSGTDRDDFLTRVAESGGQPQLNVTKKTTMLVVADHDEITAHHDHAQGRSKQRKAGEYRAAGQGIEIIGSAMARTYLAFSSRPAVLEDFDVPPQTPSTQEDPIVSEPTIVANEPSDSQDEPHAALPEPPTKPTNHLWYRALSVLGIALLVLSALFVLMMLLGGVFGVLPQSTSIGDALARIIGVVLALVLFAAPGVFGWFLWRWAKRRRQS